MLSNSEFIRNELNQVYIKGQCFEKYFLKRGNGGAESDAVTTWLEVSEEKTISEGLETLDIW